MVGLEVFRAGIEYQDFNIEWLKYKVQYWMIEIYGYLTFISSYIYICLLLHFNCSYFPVKSVN